MYSSGDLIEAVQRRLRLVQRRGHPPGEFPPGWKAWLSEAALRPGRVTGATADAMVGVLVARPLAQPPRRVADLTRWQAFSSVWRQQWQAPEPEQRGLRWLAAGGSAVVHIALAIFMLWLLFAPPRFDAPPAAGELVVQVEYVGEGTPAEVGGPSGEDAPAVATEAPAPSQAPTDAPADADSAAAPADPTEPPPPRAPRIAEVAAPPAPPLEVPVPEMAQRDIPTPSPPADQPIAVSEVVPDTPTVEFVLPPTRRAPQPRIESPELDARVPEVAVREVPMPLQARIPAPRELPVGELASPDLPMRAADVGQRDVPAPIQPRALPQVAVPTQAAPGLRADTPDVRERSIPMPARPVPPADAVAGAGDGEAATRASSPSASSTSERPAAGMPSARAGQGPRPDPAPGAWPSPRRGDDLGAASEARPGGQRGRPGQPPGLYDGEGRVRLAEPGGSASPNRPPGAITEEIADLDRAGTWLRRPPTDYEPTVFDKYWRPSETLLEEWVRKGYKEVAIPIPGTNKRIICGIAFLALGGGCGISDPNLNEQPATARPPPDIPFKPHLQEGDAARPPGG